MARSRPLYLCFLIGKLLSIMSMPLHTKQLVRSTTTMFFIGQEMQYWQLHYDNMPAHASHFVQSFLVKHQITPVTQSPYSPDLSPRGFWLFPKLKHLGKGRDFRLSMRLRKIWWCNWCQLEELCEVPRCLPWSGLRHHRPVYNVSCVLYLSQ